MADVVFMNKKQEGFLKYLDSQTKLYGLKKDIDFEIVSIVVLSDYSKAFSLGEFLGIRSNELFKDSKGKYLNTAKKLLQEKQFKAISETLYPRINEVSFYEVKDQIDIDLASEVGLGVVKYKEKYMLYYPFQGEDPKSIVYEMLMLKVYFQLLHPEDVDVKLQAGFGKYASLIQSMMVANGRKHIQRLKEIFANHK